MLLTLLHDDGTDVSTKVISYQDLHILLGDAAVNVLQEDLFEKGLKFSHIEPATFIGSENTAGGCTSGPSLVKVSAGTLKNGHGGGEITITTGAKHRAESGLAVIFDLLRVANPLLEEALPSPRVIPHARFIVIEDVGGGHPLNLATQVRKVLSDAVV